MVQVLRLNNTTDLLKHNLTFDEVIMTFNAKTEPGDYYIDARAGIANAYIYRFPTTNQDTTSASAPFSDGIYVDDVKRTDVTNIQIPVNTKTTLRLVFSATGTDDVNLFSQNTGNNKLPVDIYDIKFLLGGVLQAHLDATKGTANDQSGNGRDFTLTGGTWLDDGTGGTPTSTPESTAFATKQVIYQSDSVIFPMVQNFIETSAAESNTFQTRQLIFALDTQSFSTRQRITDSDTQTFPHLLRIYSTDTEVFPMLQVIDVGLPTYESAEFPFRVFIHNMLVIEHDITGERFMFPRHNINKETYEGFIQFQVVPRGFHLSEDQTAVPIIYMRDGQTELVRWEANSKDPVNTMEKWSK